MMWLLPEDLSADNDTWTSIGESPLMEREVLAALGQVAEARPSPLPHTLVAYP